MSSQWNSLVLSDFVRYGLKDMFQVAFSVFFFFESENMFKERKLSLFLLPILCVCVCASLWPSPILQQRKVNSFLNLNIKKYICFQVENGDYEWHVSLLVSFPKTFNWVSYKSD